jgi:hypothetical protein
MSEKGIREERQIKTLETTDQIFGNETHLPLIGNDDLFFCEFFRKLMRGDCQQIKCIFF